MELLRCSSFGIVVDIVSGENCRFSSGSRLDEGILTKKKARRNGGRLCSRDVAVPSSVDALNDVDVSATFGDCLLLVAKAVKMPSPQ